MDEEILPYVHQLENANELIVEDLEDKIEEELYNQTGILNLSDEDKQKFFAMLAPLLLGLYGNAMNAQNTIEYKQRIYLEVEIKINEYVEHIGKLTDEASKKVNELEVEVNRLKELRNSGNDLLSSVHLANKNNVKNMQSLSPKLVKQSLDNKIAQLESHANFTRASNTLDQYGNNVYTHKRWIWSRLKRTRHRNMDSHTIIPIDEAFTVLNEVSGEVDYGLYPT